MSGSRITKFCGLNCIKFHAVIAYQELLPTEEPPFAELLPFVEEPLFEDTLLLVEELLFIEELPPVEETPLSFDVDVPGVSCSAPLLTQPVKAAAIAAARREMNIFLIYYPFPVQTRFILKLLKGLSNTNILHYSHEKYNRKMLQFCDSKTKRLGAFVQISYENDRIRYTSHTAADCLLTK